MVDTEETQGAHVFTAKPGKGGWKGGLMARASCPLLHPRTQMAAGVTTWEGPSAPGLHEWPSAPSALPHHGL